MLSFPKSKLNKLEASHSETILCGSWKQPSKEWRSTPRILLERGLCGDLYHVNGQTLSRRIVEAGLLSAYQSHYIAMILMHLHTNSTRYPSGNRSFYLEKQGEIAAGPVPCLFLPATREDDPSKPPDTDQKTARDGSEAPLVHHFPAPFPRHIRFPIGGFSRPLLLASRAYAAALDGFEDTISPSQSPGFPRFPIRATSC